MKVLVVHCRYQLFGGEDICVAAERDLLLRHGVEVVEFLDDNARIEGMNPLRLAADTIWSRETRRKLARVLGKERPDVVHFHNTFPLISPSAYYACRDAGVPVVQTLHNFRLLCPGALLMRDGRPCEACVGGAVPWRAVTRACYRGSRSASAVLAAMLATHRLLGTWNQVVDRYVALTEFAKRKLTAGGLPPERLDMKPNFVDPDPGPGAHKGGYALFVGCLSEEKGLRVLMEAWNRFGADKPLKIAGAGPLEVAVREWCDRRPGVEFLGFRDLPTIHALMQEARFLVFPSIWYETFGRVAAEAFATGLPVIASRLGAMSEIVEDGRTGLHFTAGDADDLAAKAAWSFAHPEAVREMGRRAREEYLAHYTARRNYETLMAIYQRAMLGQ
jgi:glycosyltransferase involved in cell wall biosynthesis